MKRLIIALGLVVGLNSCTLHPYPSEYIILINGTEGTDLSGDQPVKVYVNGHDGEIVSEGPLRINRCDLFVLPPAAPLPELPVFRDIEHLTNKDVANASVAHIEELRKYIEKTDITLHNAYQQYIDSCKQ